MDVDWDLERRIKALENKYYRTMLGVSYWEHRASEYYMWQHIKMFVGHQTFLLANVASYHGNYTTGNSRRQSLKMKTAEIMKGHHKGVGMCCP